MKCNLFLARPLPESRLFHIFGEDGHALCKKFAMLRLNKEYAHLITGSKKYVQGQDCKLCFKRAGLQT